MSAGAGAGRPAAGIAPGRAASKRRSDPTPVILVRLLLFLALAAIAVAGLLYLFTRDRRYLRFIGQVVKFTILLVASC